MGSEWDQAKRQTNILKHGIDFVDAIEIFADRFIETEDRRRDYGERRYRAVGQLGDHIIQVDTWRSGRRRIISARRAGRNDRRTYHAGVAEAGSQDEE
jgi:uncharacterized DUF497 family protein